jgi:hypothetical protein
VGRTREVIFRCDTEAFLIDNKTIEDAALRRIGCEHGRFARSFCLGEKQFEFLRAPSI